MSFSVGVQRELPGNWFLDVSYFGKLGRRLPAIGDPAQTLNFIDHTVGGPMPAGQSLYAAFGAVQKQLQANGDNFMAVTNQPWFENQMTTAAETAGFGSCSAEGALFGLSGVSCTQLAAAIAGALWPDGDVSSTLLFLADIQPNGNIEDGLIPLNAGLLAQDGSAAFIGNYSASSYNALIVRVNHRLSRNLVGEFDYTFSHSIDNTSDVQNALIDLDTAEICDLRNLRVCRASSDFDARHVVAANFEYQLPFGRGQWLGHDSSKLLDEAIGGWKVSGIFIAHSGFPFSVLSGTFPIDFTQTAPAVFIGNDADITGSPHVVTQNGVPAVQFFSNETNALNAFAFPFGGGTGTRNAARGPGFWNLDFALLKDFSMPWSDNQKLEFRAEGLNVFNHTNFSPPGVSLLQPETFGDISSDVNGPRQLQLGLKYSF